MHSRFKKWKTILFVLIFMGCGSSSTTKLNRGIFLDSTVHGLEYKSGMRQGITDSEGVFYYAEGDLISFSVGDVSLGSPIVAGPLLTPVDLVGAQQGFLTNSTVINIAAFLQSLDADNFPDNGIVITEAVRDTARNVYINFNQSTTAFENDPTVIDLFSRLNTPLRSAQDTITHLSTTLAQEGALPVVLICLGDGQTAGVKNGQLNQFGQTTAYVKMTAEQLALSCRLDAWNIPFLESDQQGGFKRLDTGFIPNNFAVPDTTIDSLLNQKSDTNALLNQIIAPVPALMGTAVTQLEAAEYLAAQHPDKLKFITLMVGHNDVLGSILNNMTITGIEDNTDTITNGLTTIVERLEAIPDTYLLIANLNIMENIAALLSSADINALALFEEPDVTTLPAGAYINISGLLSLGTALGSASNNEVLNTAVATLIQNDAILLSSEEAQLLNARINIINTHIQALAEQYYNVIMVDVSQFLGTTQLLPAVSGEAIALTSAYNRGYFSMDGYNFTDTGHAFIANQFINAINSIGFKINIPLVDGASIYNYDAHQDFDGDGYIPGPYDQTLIAADYLPLKDCDNDNVLIVPPFINNQSYCSLN